MEIILTSIISLTIGLLLYFFYAHLKEAHSERMMLMKQMVELTKVTTSIGKQVNSVGSQIFSIEARIANLFVQEATSPNVTTSETNDEIDLSEQTFNHIPPGLKFEIEGGDTHIPPGFNTQG